MQRTTRLTPRGVDEHTLWVFMAEKTTHHFIFPPSVITRPLTPLPLPFSYFLCFLFGFAVLLFTLCVVCLMSDSASLSWQRPAVKVGVIFLLVTAVKGHTHTPKPLSYIRFIFGAIAQLKLDSFDNFKITAVLIDDKNLRIATFINMRKCGGGFSSYLSTPGGI